MTMSEKSQGNEEWREELREEWRERLLLWLREHNQQSLSDGQDEQDNASQPGAASPFDLPAHVLEAFEARDAAPTTTRAAATDARAMRSLLGMDPPLARYGH